jgi:hypothetical protein
MKRNVKWLTAIAVVGALGLGCMAAARAAEPEPQTGSVRVVQGLQCDMRLALTLTPDVPNAQDPGFLGAILSSPSYQLTWLDGSDTQATVQLTGPGPSSQCQNVVNKLSRDSHVLDVKVLQPGEIA